MKKKMTFNTLVGKIASETKVPKELVKELLKETIALNQAGLGEEGHSSLIGLGRFSLKWHKARKGRNPKSGEVIDIPGHSTVNFKAQASLRNHINRRYAELQPELIEPEKNSPEQQKAAVPSTKPEAQSPKPRPEKTFSNTPLKEKKQVEDPKVSAVSKKPPPSKKSINKWIWPIILIFLIVLYYLFWPNSDQAELPLKEEKKSTEIVPEKEKPIPVAPVEKEFIYKTPAKIYSVHKDDYLYRIALDYYKNASLWPLIYKANINQSPNPRIVIPNTEIYLPALEGSSSKLSAQDKKELSHGYLEVYFYYKDNNKNKAIYHLWVALHLTTDISKDYAKQIDSEDLIVVSGIKGTLNL